MLRFLRRKSLSAFWEYTDFVSRWEVFRKPRCYLVCRQPFAGAVESSDKSHAL